MTHFRLIPLALVISVASTLIACNTAPTMPMGAATAIGAMPGNMTHMASPEWEKICHRMEVAFRQSNYESGVIDGVQSVARHLVKNFPSDGRRRNELSDRPVVL